MRVIRNLLSLFLLLLLQVAGSSAFWRMLCPGRLGIARMDPIMSPGKVSQHAHAIYGSNGFSMGSGFKELRAGNCSSCVVQIDKSSYWHPQLYFRDAETGMFEEVIPEGTTVYYNLYGENITAFPEGFTMVAGNNNARNWSLPWNATVPVGFHGGEPEKSRWGSEPWYNEASRRELAVGVNCIQAAATGTGTKNHEVEGTLLRHYMPNKAAIDTCLGGIRFELVFPSCWDGKDIDSNNHRDHVRYANLVLDGGCSEAAKDGFSIQLPTLMFEVNYQTQKFINRSGEYVISNGDESGLAYHGDFISGWDVNELQYAVNTCTNRSGELADCPFFASSTVSQDEARMCKLNVPDVLKNERTMGTLEQLPGGVRLLAVDPNLGLRPKYGHVDTDPALDTSGQNPNGSNPPVHPTTEGAPDNPDLSNNLPAPGIPGGGSFAEKGPEDALEKGPGDAEETYSVVSTQLITEGHRVTKILWVQEVVTATTTVDITTTVTLPSEPTNDARKTKRGQLHHIHGHHHG